MKNNRVVLVAAMFFMVFAPVADAEYPQMSKKEWQQFCDATCNEYENSSYKLISRQIVPAQDIGGYDGRKARVHESFMSFTVFYWFYYLAYYAITLLLSVLIYLHAKSRNDLALNLKPIMWGAIVVVNPVLGMLAYWVMNVMDISKLLGRNDVQA